MVAGIGDDDPLVVEEDAARGIQVRGIWVRVGQREAARRRRAEPTLGLQLGRTQTKPSSTRSGSGESCTWFAVMHSPLAIS
jgi:hypothetical protein